MHSESDPEIERKFRELLKSGLTSETVEAAEQLLNRLDVSSTLRKQLSDELDKLCARTQDPKISEQELRERFSKGGGRSLADILRDLGKSA